MSFEISTETATSKAIADLTWEIHGMRAHLESLNSRLDSYNAIGLAVIKELTRIGDAVIDLDITVGTRP